MTSTSDIRNSANKLHARTLFAAVEFGGDRFTHLLAVFPLFARLQQNAGRVHGRRVKWWQLKLSVFLLPHMPTLTSDSRP